MNNTSDSNVTELKTDSTFWANLVPRAILKK